MTQQEIEIAGMRGFKAGVEYQKEQSYTEQEVITLLEKRDDDLDYWYVHKRNNYPHLTDLFEEYKKK